MERDRRLAEKEAREVVADAESPLAQRHIRDSMKRNKVTLLFYTLAFIAPIALLTSFYFTKMKEIRGSFRDPYALPEGFDPKTGEFTDQESAKTLGNQPAPKSLVLNSKAGTLAPPAKDGTERNISKRKWGW